MQNFQKKYLSFILSFFFWGFFLAFPFLTSFANPREEEWTVEITEEELLLKKQQEEKVKEEEREQEEKIKKMKKTVELNTLFFGDIFLGRAVDRWSQKSPEKYAYPFSALNTFEKENYHAWIANLECPVTKEQASFAVQQKHLKFSCKPEYLPELQKWFEVVSLANNHTMNMNEVDGFTQTKDFLTEQGIQFFGHYDNAVKDDICEIVTFEGEEKLKEGSTENILRQYAGDIEERKKEFFADPNHIYSFGEVAQKISGDFSGILEYTRKRKISVAMCGFHSVFKLPKAEEIAVISEYSKYFPTVVMPHQGLEYRITNDSYQKKFFRQMVDAGADAVIGAHPHVVENTEVYKGKLIAYSLGNFIFDQQFSWDVQHAIGINLTFGFDVDENFQQYVRIAEQCRVFKDTCLQIAQDEQLQKPVFKIQYDIVGVDLSQKKTKKANEKDFEKLKKRAHWEKTRDQLQE
jgi:poly-gamma-glutamate synthesis protein (capsule biosynthesis protein)